MKDATDVLVLTNFPELKSSAFKRCAPLLAALLCLAALASSAGATTYTVDNPADTATPDGCVGTTGDCTLRGAINKANANSGDDAIDFDPSFPATLTLDSPLPAVTEKLSIDGDGAVALVGSANYFTNFCATATAYALDGSGTQLRVLGLPVYNVCGRAIKSSLAAPQIRVGPRRADNTVPISGAAPSGTVEIFRADAPAASGEALSLFKDGLPSVGGGYSYVPPSQPAPSEKFTAAATDTSGVTSTFADPVSAPADLVSPQLLRAVGVSNNTIRLDFDEPVAGVGGVTGAFALTMGGVARPITNVNISGSSLYIGTSLAWATGEAGQVAITGNGRVTDMTGNELLGQPTQFVWAGPGEVVPPLIRKMRTDPATFCQKKTKKCTKRRQTYLYVTLSKPSRVVFTVTKAKKRNYVLTFIRRLDAGTTKLRLSYQMSGRPMPLGDLIVEGVAEDSARNLSAPVSAAFRTVASNKKL